MECCPAIGILPCIVTTWKNLGGCYTKQSQREKNTISKLLYVKFKEQKQNQKKKNELIDTENRLVDLRDRG